MRQGSAQKVARSRRPVLGAVVVALAAGACGGDSPLTTSAASSGGIPAEAKAGAWATWVLSSADQIKVPAPPKSGSDAAKAELKEVKDLAASRSPQVEQDAHKWSDYPSLEPWVKENMQLVAQQSKNPPLVSRGYGLVSAAMYDAVISTYHWKYVYKRAAPEGTNPVVPAGPDPSYPDEHAAIAGAASRVLAYLFPDKAAAVYDQEAEAAADSRVAAGVNFRSDTDAGLALGRAVADAVVARAKADGSDAHFTGTIPTGPDHWAPDPGTTTGPTEPLAGTWKTWVTDVKAVRPGPPPAYGSAQFAAEAKEVMEVTKGLTAEQKRIADFWKDAGGTPLPPGHWNQILLDAVRKLQLSTPKAARAFALLNIAESDAGIAAWDAKYAYWSPRPINLEAHRRAADRHATGGAVPGQPGLGQGDRHGNGPQRRPPGRGYGQDLSAAPTAPGPSAWRTSSSPSTPTSRSACRRWRRPRAPRRSRRRRSRWSRR